jgi:citronellol/citronellal dehydrogenase
MHMDLTGKTAIVTGAARGIGKAIALALATAGADVLVVARTEINNPDLPGTIADTVHAIEKLGGRAVAHRADLMSDPDIRSMVGRAMQEFGRIDLLVNNAAYIPSGTVLNSPIDELDKIMRVNLRAPYLASQLVVPIMRQSGGGAIFNISMPNLALTTALWTSDRNAVESLSVPERMKRGAALIQFKETVHPGYLVSKSALDALTIMLATECSEHNIAVTSIDPGFTDTEMARHLTVDGFDTSFANDPNLIGKVVAFMARDPMSLTGQIVVATDIAEQNII